MEARPEPESSTSGPSIPTADSVVRGVLLPPEDRQSDSKAVAEIHGPSFHEYMSKHGRSGRLHELRKEPEVLQLVLGGIGAEDRGEYWLSISGAKLAMLKAGPDHYLNRVAAEDESPEAQAALAQIELDWDRTGGSEGQISTSFASVDKLALRRVLTAVSRELPHIGYCQSMNFLAALLLSQVEEEEAFWLLVTIARDILAGYYSVSLIGCRVDQAVFAELVHERMPKAAAAVDSSMGIPAVGILSYHWFLTIFCTSIKNTDLLLLIWDLFFLRGAETIFEIALSIFASIEHELEAAEDPSVVTLAIESGMDKLTVETLLHVMNDASLRIPAELLMELRSKHLQKLKAEEEEMNEKLRKLSKENGKSNAMSRRMRRVSVVRRLHSTSSCMRLLAKEKVPKLDAGKNEERESDDDGSENEVDVVEFNEESLDDPEDAISLEYLLDLYERMKKVALTNLHDENMKDTTLHLLCKLKRDRFTRLWDAVCSAAKDVSWSAGDIFDAFQNKFDSSGQAIVDLREVLCGLSVMCEASREVKLHFLYSIYDLNGNQSLEEDEITEMMQAVFSMFFDQEVDSNVQSFVKAVFSKIASGSTGLTFAQFREVAVMQPLILQYVAQTARVTTASRLSYSAHRLDRYNSYDLQQTSIKNLGSSLTHKSDVEEENDYADQSGEDNFSRLPPEVRKMEYVRTTAAAVAGEDNVTARQWKRFIHEVGQTYMEKAALQIMLDEAQLKILRMQNEHQAEITRLELRLKDADAKATMNQQLLHDLLQEKK